MRARGWGDGVVHDVRCAFRSMRRFPVATTVAIASLAAGIAATAATLTIRDAVSAALHRSIASLGQLTRLRLANNRASAALYEHWKPSLGSSGRRRDNDDGAQRCPHRRSHRDAPGPGRHR